MSDLPPGWKRVRLDEIAEVRLGRQRSPKNHSGTNMRPYLRAANVDWSGLKLDDVKRMNFTDEEAEIYRLRPGDIVLGEASGSAAEVGKSALWNGEIQDCCLQNTLIRVRSDGPDPKYLLYFFRYEALRGAFAIRARGVGIHHLGAARLSAWEVPLPPVAEQHRIVAALEEHLPRLQFGASLIASGTRKLGRLRARLLVQAVSGALSGRSGGAAEGLVNEILRRRDSLAPQRKSPARPVQLPDYRLPSNWAIASLDALSYDSGYGTSAKCDYRAVGEPVLRIPNIQRGEVDFSDLKRTVDPMLNLNQLYVSPGDLLFVRTNGSRELIGRVATVRSSMQVAFASYLIRFRLVPNGVNPDWVKLVVSSPLWRRYLETRAASSAGQYNLSIRVLAPVPIPVPPREEQDTILARFEEQVSGAAVLETALANARRRTELCISSVLAKAFAGQLVPQDPSNEPVSSLLARISRGAALRHEPNRSNRITNQARRPAIQQEKLL